MAAKASKNSRSIRGSVKVKTLNMVTHRAENWELVTIFVEVTTSQYTFRPFSSSSKKHKSDGPDGGDWQEKCVGLKHFFFICKMG